MKTGVGQRAVAGETT